MNEEHEQVPVVDTATGVIAVEPVATQTEQTDDPMTYDQALRLVYACKVGIQGKEKNRFAVQLPAGGLAIGETKESAARQAVIATGGRVG